MRRRQTKAMLPVALIAAALLLGACGGGDDEDSTSTSTSTTPATTNPPPAEAPSESGAPPGAGQLPAELVECFEDKGIEVRSPGDIHSAPPEVVQECFSALHGGGGP